MTELFFWLLIYTMDGFFILVLIFIFLLYIGVDKAVSFLFVLLLSYVKRPSAKKVFGGARVKYFLLDDDPSYKEWLHKKLRKRLTSMGWKELKFGDNIRRLDLVSIRPRKYIQLKGVIPRAQLYSRREKQIMYKNELYKLMQKLDNGKYMMKQYEVDINKDNPDDYKHIEGKTWMMKPTTGSQGVGIKLIKSFKQFKKIFEEEKRSQRFANTVANTDLWVLSEYMNDMMLWEGKKFHLRMYYCVIINGDKKEGILLDHGKIFVSKKKYSEKSNDPDVHNIHANNSDAYDFPNDFKHKKLIKKIMAPLKTITKFLFKNSRHKCFDSSVCFQLYGMDVAVHVNGDIKIFEVNSHPGAKTEHDVATDKIVDIIDDKIISLL